MLDENPAEAAEPTTPTQDTETAATEASATGGAGDGETAAPGGTAESAAPTKKTTAKRTAKKATAKKTTAKKAPAKRTTKKAAAAPEEPGETLFAGVAGDQAATEGAPGRPTPGAAQAAEVGADDAAETAPAKRTRKSAAKKTTAKRTTKKAATAAPTEPAPEAEGQVAAGTAEAESLAEALAATPVAPEPDADTAAETEEESAAKAAPAPATALLFQPPDPTKAVVTTRRRKSATVKAAEEAAPEAEELPQEKPAKKAAKKKPAKKSAEVEGEPAEEKAVEAAEEGGPEGEEEQGGERRRRRRGGRRRRRSGGDETEGAEAGERGEAAEDKEATEEEGEEGAGTSRRRRRRRRGEGEGEEPRARKPRNAEDEITALSGSTRLEAKKQRRREGREAGRRRAPIVSEAEFLARRESVDRVMVIRQREDLTQIAVLEDKVLVEHYVARESQTSLIGNVYLGRVQNVLPSMEAAFIDIGKGRNAVLYAGEVNWAALGHKNGTPRKIESVLKSGQPILVQVTKDPIGHKGARLTSQISLPGRFLVYVPDGTTSGISRKLPDTERNRLKTLLKEIVPESAGVIVRTAAEGASEDELTRDVERLTARWEDIAKKVKAGNAPQLLYGEPDLTLKVVRDLFTEDFDRLVIAGDDAWDTVEGYVSHVAPDLNERLEKYDGGRDVFAEYRIDEQIEKALDRKVWLPSGGSLVIDRTEAMTVVDVNTGKFTGSGGNLEETVTKNNLEAAEEIVRQLRLRDIGGIIVIDFIDMVLESNRDLVLRRLVECLGRDRTRHQVAEVTSLGLVQMTRKRIGTGLLEAFSESCEHCQGRGLVLHHEPVEPKKKADDDSRRGRRGGGRGRGRDQGDQGSGGGVPSPKDFAAMARHEEKVEAETAETPSERQSSEETEEKVSVRKAEQRAETPAVDEAPEAAAVTEAAPETEQAAEAAAPPAEPKVTVRSRSRGRGRGRKATAEAQPQGEQPAAEQTGAVAAEEGSPREQPTEAEAESPAGTPVESAGEPATEAVTEPTQDAPAPAAPTVVTTVRRRSARRAAGPPSEAAAAAATTATTAEGTTQGSVDGSRRGGVDVAEIEQVTDEPSDTDPVAALVDSAELDGSDMGADEVPATPHVPVKKRGSRRR